MPVSPERIACSRMYNVADGARRAWRDLFTEVSRRCGIPLRVIDHAAPAPLEDLWSRADLGCVFMCGWPYLRAVPKPVLVAAAVPRSSTRQAPEYRTAFVALAAHGHACLADTFGGRLAYTVEGSHSGFNAVRHHLLSHYGNREKPLYRALVGPVVTPLGAVDSVRDGRADVAPVDSYALDLLRRHAPERLQDLAVIEWTTTAPMPPLVASPQVPEADIAALRAVLLASSTLPGLAEHLEALELAGFAAIAPAAYDVIGQRDSEARAAGYPRPG